jgi:hypothetical protein
MFLIVGSISISVVTYLMQPSNLNHINRIKYLIHACSVWMCMTCLWAISNDNRSWQRHAVVCLVGWFACFVAFGVFESIVFSKDLFRQAADGDVLAKCDQEVQGLQHNIVSGVRTWANHADILRLMKFATHEHAFVQKRAFESLAVLSYLDQMTKRHSFFAYAPSTCMEIFCKAVAVGSDHSQTRSFAIRALKTFLQEERYTLEMSALFSGGLKIAEPVAACVVEPTQQLAPKVDAAICLLAMCSIDSNQLKYVVSLLPTLNDWMRAGPLVAQHLALELIANLASRFDLSTSIITCDCMPCIFELFTAIDESMNIELAKNTEAGFRKGQRQPDSFTNLAHQLPRRIIAGLDEGLLQLYCPYSCIYGESL